MAKKPTYDQVDRLTDYSFSRLRTEVNFGSREPTSVEVVNFDGESLTKDLMTVVPALTTYFREILDNALDEAKKCSLAGLKGHGTELDVQFDPESMVFTVQDNGRGIPSDLVQMVFTEARTGRNFRERDEVAGTNGVGAATTNFTSTYFRVDSYHDGTHHHQVFKEGAGDKQIIGEAEVKRCPKNKHGTRIEFQPSPDVYPDTSLPEKYVRARCYEIAAINPDMTVTYNGKKLSVDRRLEKSLLKGMNPVIVEVEEDTVTTSQKHRTLGGGSTAAREGKFYSAFYLVPDFSSSQDDTVHSVVNNICAYNGGTHVSAFKTAFYKGMTEALAKESRKRKLSPNKSDIGAGLLIYNVTRMQAPNFDSQTKNRLINEDARKLIEKGLGDEVFRGIVKSRPEWVDAIFERCAKRTGRKEMDEAERLDKKNKKNKVAKLKDATSRNRKECILIIGEGDSAVSGAMNARDPKIHGGLPLRGKILNVNGESPARVMKSEPMTDIMNALGLRLSERAARATLRYGKLFIATDEDEDGKNIFSLIVNFLFTYWPELFDPDLEPFVFKLETPFIILKRKKERKYFYGREYHDYRSEDWKGWDASRAKGLGRLEFADWKNVLSNPPVIPIQDVDGTMKDALDLVFNNTRADDRKAWLAERVHT